MVFPQRKMLVGIEEWRAGIVNNKFNFIFHVKNPHQGSLIDLCLALAGPIVSIYSCIYFFIITSVVNIPLSALLTFLLTNISQLDRLWSDMLCQHEGVVSNVVMTGEAEGVRDWSDHLRKTSTRQLLVRPKF